MAKIIHTVLFTFLNLISLKTKPLSHYEDYSFQRQVLLTGSPVPTYPPQYRCHGFHLVFLPTSIFITHRNFIPMALSVVGSTDSRSADDVVASEIAAFRRSLSSMSAATSGPLEEQEPKEKTTWTDIYRGDITEHHLLEMSQELGLINLCWENVDCGFEW